MNLFCVCGNRINNENDICCDQCFAEYIEQHYLEYILENAEDFTVEKLTITEFCKQDRSHFIEFLQSKGYLELPFEQCDSQGYLDEVDSRIDMFKDDSIYRAI